MLRQCQEPGTGSCFCGLRCSLSFTHLLLLFYLLSEADFLNFGPAFSIVAPNGPNPYPIPDDCIILAADFNLHRLDVLIVDEILELLFN